MTDDEHKEWLEDREARLKAEQEKIGKEKLLREHPEDEVAPPPSDVPEEEEEEDDNDEIGPANPEDK